MLPVNFHQTFIPERRLIASLLEYAALGKEGSLKEIGKQTGIPMGEYSGKVPAIIDYALGMNLIEIGNEKGDVIKKPVLTPLGRVVFLEDKYLSEGLVQWIAHINLCRSDIGATAWHVVFAQGRKVLGTRFNKAQLEDYLVSIYGPGRDRTGPLVSAYLEDIALSRAAVLTLEGTQITRKRAPLYDSYALAYSAQVLSFMEAFFSGQEQVTVTDFNQVTCFFDVCLWNQSEIELFFELLEPCNHISVDRQMRPWIIEKKTRAEEVWPHIYDDLA